MTFTIIPNTTFWALEVQFHNSANIQSLDLGGGGFKLQHTHFHHLYILLLPPSKEVIIR